MRGRLFDIIIEFIFSPKRVYPRPERIDFRPEISDESNFRHEKCLSMSEG